MNSGKHEEWYWMIILLNDNTPVPTFICLMLATLGAGTLYPRTSLVRGNIRGQGEQAEIVSRGQKL